MKKKDKEDPSISIKPRTHYTCDICNYVTYDKSNYTKHRRKHDDPRCFLYKRDQETKNVNSQEHTTYSEIVKGLSKSPPAGALSFTVMKEPISSEDRNLMSMSPPTLSQDTEETSLVSAKPQGDLSSNSQVSVKCQSAALSPNIEQIGLVSARLVATKKAQVFTSYPCLCEICGKSFTNKSGLTCHIQKTHNKLCEHVCHECGKGFTTKHKYLLHCAKHEREKKSVCSFCQKEFSSRSVLTQHLEQCDKLNKDLHVCFTCQATFANNMRLQSHIKGMHGEPRFGCNICGKKFKWRSSLSSHMLHSHRDIMD